MEVTLKFVPGECWYVCFEHTEGYLEMPITNFEAERLIEFGIPQV